MSDSTNEIRWLEALGKGDKNAFASLYRAYAGKCVNFALMLTKDEQTSRDITHDVFIRIWKKRETIARVDSFSRYLFRMMRNGVMDHFERNQINRKFIARQTMEIEEFKSFIDEKVELDELQALIAKALEKMPQQRREVFELSRYKGLNNNEIATHFGISIRTVEKHISNALSDIRKELKENFA
ncbi:MAG: RNA polymerase sigma-70 factor [Candidatus Cryptobacteroides sp.]|nr:RNA polymerase sigma-70 factor [Bacteroidales bacterium]